MQMRGFVLGACLWLAAGGPTPAAPGFADRAGQVGGQVGGIVTPAPQPPVRDRALPVAVGRATLRGRVVDAQTGLPLPRAQVRLFGQGQPRSPVLTDEQGQFGFSALGPGIYNISVDKGGYANAFYPERARSLRAQAAQTLIVRDGDTIDSVVVRLFRGSAITGRVVDAHGDPVESAQVAVVGLTAMGGGRSGFRSSGQTNDIGEFRLGRIQPGRYILMVIGQGRYQDPMTIASAPLPQPVPTYYPNVLSRADAQPISIGRGQTVSGIEVVMFEDRPTVVTGRILVADGQALPSSLGGVVTVRLDQREMQGAMMSNASIRPDGSFRILLPPGNYIFEARGSQQAPRPVTGTGRPEQLVGTSKVSIAGESMDVSIVVGGGATAAGRIIFEGDTPPPPAPPPRQGAPLSSVDNGSCTSGRLEIAADWTFKVDGLSGTCTSPPFGPFGRWTLKSVRFDGQELVNRSVAFEPGQHFGNVQIVVTDKRNEITLQVSDERGQRTREYVAVVFSTDKARWDGSFTGVRTYLPPPPDVLAVMQGLVAAGQPNPAARSAREAIGGLPPGDYYAIALDDLDADASGDPAVLERLAASATRVTVVEGQTEVMLPRLRQADVIR